MFVDIAVEMESDGDGDLSVVAFRSTTMRYTIVIVWVFREVQICSYKPE